MIRIGKKLSKRGAFERFLDLTEELLHQSALVLGRTGAGKSRWLHGLAHGAFVDGFNTNVFDPDGDLVENLLAQSARDVAVTGDKKRLRKVHYLDLSFHTAWRYDPFRFRIYERVHPELLQNAYEAWRHCRVDAMGQVLLRNQGQSSFEGMPRLERVLGLVLTVLSSEIDGKRLSLADAAMVLDFSHPLKDRLWNKVERLLPQHVAADFRLLRHLKRTEDMRRETESTVNKIRSVLGPVTRAIFSEPGKPSFHFYDAAQRGHLVLVNLRPSMFVSESQAVAIGRMLIYDWISVTTATPRELRKTSVGIIDEAGGLLLPDIGPALRRGRKYKRGIVLASQELSSFRHKEFDLTDVVLSQPHTVISYQQRLPLDLQTLARLMFTGELSFEELVNEVERDGGTEWLPVLERSWSRTRNAGWNEGESDGESDTESESETKTLAEAMNWQDGTSSLDGRGRTSTESQTASGKLTHEWTPGLGDRQVGTGTSLAATQNHQEGVNHSAGGSKTASAAKQEARSRQNTRGRNSGISGGLAEGETLSLRYAQVKKTIRERVATGQLKKPVATQLEEFAQWIFRLKPRFAFALLGNDVHYMESIDVPDPFPSALSIVKAVRWVQRELREVHQYLFTPDLGVEEERRRILDVLGLTAADEPVFVGGEGDEGNLIA